MGKGLAVIAMALVGGLIAAQPAINSTLAKSTGSLPAAFVSFFVGTLALGAIVVLSGQAGRLSSVGEVGPLYLVGGLLGAVYVFSALLVVREIGAGGVAAATIAGQLSFSVVLDRAGAFGLAEIPVTWDRLVGVLLLVAGTFLIVR